MPASITGPSGPVRVVVYSMEKPPLGGLLAFCTHLGREPEQKVVLPGDGAVPWRFTEVNRVPGRCGGLLPFFVIVCDRPNDLNVPCKLLRRLRSEAKGLPVTSWKESPPLRSSGEKQKLRPAAAAFAQRAMGTGPPAVSGSTTATIVTNPARFVENARGCFVSLIKCETGVGFGFTPPAPPRSRSLRRPGGR